MASIEKRIEAMLRIDEIDKRFNPPVKMNTKKVFQLLGLYMLYCILLGVLITLLGIFSFGLYVITYGIGCVIGWEIFVKPIWNEIAK